MKWFLAALLAAAFFAWGYSLGLSDGRYTTRKEVNQWWIDQKSTSGGTSEMLKEWRAKEYNHI